MRMRSKNLCRKINIIDRIEYFTYKWLWNYGSSLLSRTPRFDKDSWAALWTVSFGRYSVLSCILFLGAELA